MADRMVLIANIREKVIMNIKTQPTYALKNMIKSLSSLELLNTDEENKRLKLAKQELKTRRTK